MVERMNGKEVYETNSEMFAPLLGAELISAFEECFKTVLFFRKGGRIYKLKVKTDGSSFIFNELYWRCLEDEK